MHDNSDHVPAVIMVLGGGVGVAAISSDITAPSRFAIPLFHLQGKVTDVVIMYFNISSENLSMYYTIEAASQNTK